MSNSDSDFDINKIPDIVKKMTNKEILEYKNKTDNSNYTKYTYEERLEWSKNQNNMLEFKYKRELNRRILNEQKYLLSLIKGKVDNAQV